MAYLLLFDFAKTRRKNSAARKICDESPFEYDNLLNIKIVKESQGWIAKKYTKDLK
jgi:hypothetical protein